MHRHHDRSRGQRTSRQNSTTQRPSSREPYAVSLRVWSSLDGDMQDIDIEMEVDVRAAARTESCATTIDYVAVAEQVRGSPCEARGSRAEPPRRILTPSSSPTRRAS